MCGRLNVSEDPLARVFVLLTGQPYPGAASPNVTPTETVWVISAPAEDAADAGSTNDAGTPAPLATQFVARSMRWWLVPYWLPDPKPKYAMFNARSDSLAKSRAFKGSFERRRCLVPVTGYYEWRNEDGAKLPSYVCAADAGAAHAGAAEAGEKRGRALLLAGIWDRWRDAHQTIESCAIITVDVNAQLAFLHDRQPLMLHEQDIPRWLARDTPLQDVRDMLRSDLPLDLAVTPVSTYVNTARNKGAQCLTATGNPRFVAANRD